METPFIPLTMTERGGGESVVSVIPIFLMLVIIIIGHVLTLLLSYLVDGRFQPSLAAC